jgi:diguanylate cyclase (GGDEF)-like protein/PAS domain S-box-containing protein/excisionase family DNA binding protein
MNSISDAERRQERRKSSRRRSLALDPLEYTIQEAAAKLGIPEQKLRRWDTQGVLVARRTEGGHRRYSKEIVNGLAGSADTENQLGDSQDDALARALQDIKEKRRIIQLLVESESRYRDLVETSHDLIWTTDAIGRFTYLNNGSHDIFGLPPSALIGRCFFDFESHPSHISNRRFLSTLRKHGEIKDYLTHLVASDGSDRWVGINARVSYDAGQIVGLRGTARNITEQHKSALQVEYLATHDSLTGLPNRVSLQRDLEQAIDSGEKGAILQLDLDNFKLVNDKHGHRVGDRLLISVGSVLSDLIMERDATVYRLGGDEFAMHMPDALRNDAQTLAEQTLNALRRFTPQVSNSRDFSPLTASIGIATYPFQGNDFATLLTNADIAMYQAKADGRNRHVTHDASSEEIRTTHRRAHWTREIRDALDDDRVAIFSQPASCLTSSDTRPEELLARIIGRNGELILPDKFIPVAESLGLAQEIDLRIVEKTLQYLATSEKPSGGDRKYFVNLSVTSISDPRWLRRLHTLLSRTSVNLTELVFEITENAAMSNIGMTQILIRQLRELGCSCALDNFGVGFSSFYYLKRFDVDYLKIDGSFVSELATDEASRLFVRSLCDVAKGLNKHVIAERVETSEVLALLKPLGVDFAQGHHIAYPKPFIVTHEIALQAAQSA